MRKKHLKINGVDQKSLTFCS